MGDSFDSGGNLGNGSVFELTGRIMVVTVIVLLFIVIFVVCLHLYAKWYWSRRPDAAAGTGRRRRGTGHQDRRAVSSGLNASALEAIPVVLFDRGQFKDGLECAVCLSEVSEGEKTRLLPKCNHGFHVECIDMWFHSHSTCPICRNPVTDQKSNSEADTTMEGILQTPVGDSSPESPNLPTNVLFWGDETRVSTFGPRVEESRQGGESSSSSSSLTTTAVAVSTSNRPDGALVIDIPRQRQEEEEQKSPTPRTLRSLRRLLSGNNRKVNPSSPRNQDVERGVLSQT